MKRGETKREREGGNENWMQEIALKKEMQKVSQIKNL
jgi:hypothetical protein